MKKERLKKEKTSSHGKRIKDGSQRGSHRKVLSLDYFYLCYVYIKALGTTVQKFWQGLIKFQTE